MDLLQRSIVVCRRDEFAYPYEKDLRVPILGQISMSCRCCLGLTYSDKSTTRTRSDPLAVNMPRTLLLKTDEPSLRGSPPKNRASEEQLVIIV